MRRIAARDRHRFGAYKRVRGQKLRWSRSAADAPAPRHPRPPVDPWISEVNAQISKETWHEIQRQREVESTSGQDSLQGSQEESSGSVSQETFPDSADPSSDGSRSDASGSDDASLPYALLRNLT